MRRRRPRTRTVRVVGRALWCIDYGWTPLGVPYAHAVEGSVTRRTFVGPFRLGRAIRFVERQRLGWALVDEDE